MTEQNIQTTTSPPEFTKTAPPAGLDPTNPSAPAAHDRPQHSTVLCVDSLDQAIRFRVAGDEQELAELGTLTTEEQCALERCEGVIRKNKDSFRRFATALDEIRRRKLFRARFRSFEAYCQEVHGFGKSYAYRQAAAGRLFLEKSPMGEKLPENERQSRALLAAKRAKPVVAPPPPADCGELPGEVGAPAGKVVLLPTAGEPEPLAKLQLFAEQAYNIHADSARRQELERLLFKLNSGLKRWVKLTVPQPQSEAA